MTVLPVIAVGLGAVALLRVHPKANEYRRRVVAVGGFVAPVERFELTTAIIG